jgi:hypothetical protein
VEAVQAENHDIVHEIITAVSLCDIVYSIAYMLSTLPIPEYNSHGEPVSYSNNIHTKVFRQPTLLPHSVIVHASQTGIEGASGTEATCVLQGFVSLIAYRFIRCDWNSQLTALFTMSMNVDGTIWLHR